MNDRNHPSDAVSRIGLRLVGRSDVERRENVIFASLALPIGIYSFQQMSVIPVLPTLQRDLGASATWSTWLLTGLLLFASVFTPVMGKLGDQFGRKRIFQVALALFVVSSFGAAVSPNIWLLIAFRTLQGSGSAMIPVAMALITEQFRKERAGGAVGGIASILASGAIVGLVISGALSDVLSWRYVFALVGVVSAIGALIVHRLVPESVPGSSGRRVDVPGIALLAVTVVSLLLALTEGHDWGWLSERILGLLALSVLAGACLVLVELRTREPFLDLRLLSKRTVVFANATSVIAGFSIWAVLRLLPQFVSTPSNLSPAAARFVHYGFGASTTQAALYLLPTMAMGLVASWSVGPVGRRYGWKWPLALGFALYAIGFALLALWHDRPWQVVLAMFAVGYGVPISGAMAANLVLGAVPRSEAGVATGLNHLGRNIGGVIGAQTAAAILASYTIGGSAVPSESAYVLTFAICALVSLVGIPLALLATRRNPTDVPVTSLGGPTGHGRA